MTDEDLGLLLVRFADHSLSEEEEGVLERALSASPAARAQLWRMAEQAIAAKDAGQRHAAQSRLTDVGRTPPEPTRRWRAPWAFAVAAAGSFLAAVLVFVIHGGPGIGPGPTKTPAGPPSSWELDFSVPPVRMTGNWQPAADGEPARISAAPALERNKDGTSFAHQCVTLRAPSNLPSDAFVAAGPDSVLRLKLRMKRPFTLQLMISTRRPDGSFGGNFELTKLYPELVAGPDWHSLEVPLKTFRPLHPDLGKSAAGNDISIVIISTLHEPVGLEVAGIAVLPRPTEEKEKR